VGAAVFAQEKVGLTVSSEIAFGDLGKGADYAFVTKGVPKDGAPDHVVGLATWIIPKIAYSTTIGKWSIGAGAKLTLSSQKDYNAPNYVAALEEFKVTYAVNDAVKVWGAFAGAGAKVTPGASYATGPFTISAELPLEGGFALSKVGFEPKVAYASGPLSASLKGVLKFVYTVPEGTADSDGWNKTENYEHLSIVQKIEVVGAYTAGPVKIEATFKIPLYAGWNDGNDGKVGDPSVGTNEFNFTGVIIEPKITYTVNSAVSAFAKVELSRIGLGSEITDSQLDKKGKKVGLGIVPTIGVTYAF
jgi:hypothetical protein